MKDNEISILPAKSGRKELDPKQGKLDLRVNRQAEPDGIGMGVLNDGTAFLTGRGLARLVGIENLHIRTISQEWNDDPEKPRIASIKAILAKRGITALGRALNAIDLSTEPSRHDGTMPPGWWKAGLAKQREHADG